MKIFVVDKINGCNTFIKKCLCKYTGKTVFKSDFKPVSKEGYYVYTFNGNLLRQSILKPNFAIKFQDYVLEAKFKKLFVYETHTNNGYWIYYKKTADGNPLAIVKRYNF